MLFLSEREARTFFFGEIKPGLQLVHDSKKTSYFIYVPASFAQGKKWPLVVGLAEWGSNTKDYIKRWATEAEKRGYVVLCPNWPKAKDSTPEMGDRWLLKVIRKVVAKYSIDKKRILLTGFADGADYAYYLALRYPKKFSAAAPIGGGLSRSYENLIYYGDIERHPLPFFVLNGKKDPFLEERYITLDSTRKSAEKLRNRRLDVQYQEVEGLAHEYKDDFNLQILNWFESKWRN